MRVLFVTGSSPPMRCGVGDYTHRLAVGLAAVAGNDIAVLTSSDHGIATTPAGVAVFPVMRSWRIFEAWALYRQLRRWAPDVVHVQYPTQGYRAGLLPALVPMLAWLARASVVQTWHEPFARRSAVQVLMQRLVPGRIIVVRQRYLELLHPMVRRLVPRRRLGFIPNASSIPRATLTPEQREVLRRRYLKGQRRLTVFFGFLYRHKGVDLVFDVADPDIDHIVIVGDTDQLDVKSELQEMATSPRWAGKVTFTGFLEADDIASLLSAADAVLLPFRSGGGEWNTSIHGAVLNGAYVITTSTERHGYDPESNVFYAPVDALDEMRLALTLASFRAHAGRGHVPDWPAIVAAHMDIYRGVQRAPHNSQ